MSIIESMMQGQMTNDEVPQKDQGRLSYHSKRRRSKDTAKTSKKSMQNCQAMEQ